MSPIIISDIARVVPPVMAKYRVKRARLFGSFARNEQRSDSDVDILVSFAKPIDGWSFSGMARELEEILGRPVDLVTENARSDSISRRWNKRSLLGDNNEYGRPKIIENGTPARYL